MLRIFDTQKNLQLITNNYTDGKIEHDLATGDKTFTFIIPLNSKEADIIKEEGYLQTKSHEFVIKELGKNFNSFNVVATLNVEDLEGKYHKTFEVKRVTIEEAINFAVVGTGWKVGSSDVAKRRTVRKEKIYAWDLVQAIKRIYNCDLVFDSVNKIINIHSKLGSNKGEYLREDINLVNINYQSNTYDFFTRVEAEGADGLTFSDINDGKSYVENLAYSNKILTYYWKDERYTDKESLLEDAQIKLHELSNPKRSYGVDMINLLKDGEAIHDYGLGDTIELVSKTIKVKELQRIVKLVEYLEDPMLNYVELSNTLDNIEDINLKFEEAAATLEGVTNEDGTLDGSMIDEVDADKIKKLDERVNSLTADKISTTQLNAAIAEIGQLISTKADITELEAALANINKLIANKAEIGDLEAVNALIKVLEAAVARIDTLLAGNITSDNIHSSGISSDKLNIKDGFIQNAMIDNVSANKMTTGTVNTNNVNIESKDGAIRIAGSTQQFKDKNGNVRIQMGKDSQGNFTFSIFDETGKGVLIDHTGIKEKALADGIIKENMIGDGEIGGKKININSMISEVNKGSSTIKGSKILLDTELQTLDIAFGNLKIETEENKETLESHDTQLNIQKGKIDTLISDTTIEKEGNTLKLKDEYSKLEQSVNNIKTTIGDHESSIAEHGKTLETAQGEIYTLKGKVVNVESAQSEINQELDRITQRVSSTESATVSLTTEMNKVDGKIDKAKTQAVKDARELVDTRDENQPPSYYFENYPAQTITEFKKSAIIQIPIQGTGTYGTLETKTPWYNKSGGYPIQTFRSNNTKTYERKGLNENEWSDWVQIEDVLGSQNKANSALNSAKEFTNIEITKTNSKVAEIVTDLDSITQRVSATENTTVSLETGVQEANESAGQALSKANIANIQAEENKGNISNIKGEINKTNNKVAEIVTDLSSITQRVSTTESTTASLTTEMNKVDGKIEGAKNKAIEDSKAFTNIEISKTNNKVAQVETTVNGISSKVTDVERELVTIDDKILSNSERLNEAEQKITADAIINTVSSTIDNKIKPVNDKVQGLDAEIQNRVTTQQFTEFKQSYEDFKLITGERANIDNLVPNGAFTFGYDAWGGHSTVGTGFYWDVYENQQGYDLRGRNCLCTKNTNRYLTEQSVWTKYPMKVKKNTYYTINFHYVAEGNIEKVRAYGIFSKANGHGYDKVHEILSKSGGTQTNTWEDIPHSAVVYSGDCEYLWLRFDHDGIRNGADVNTAHWLYIADVAVYEGKVGAIPYIKNSNEMKNANTSFNSDGMEIRFEDGTYIKAGRDGFKWYNAGTGFTHHAICHVASINIPAGGSVKVELPAEFYTRRHSIRSSAAFRGYYYGTTGNFFPMHIQVTGAGYTFDDANRKVYITVEGIAKIQNAQNPNDVQNMPTGINAYVIALC